MTRLRRILKGAAVTGVVLAISLLGTEIAARWLFRRAAVDDVYLGQLLSRIYNSGISRDPSSDSYDPRLGFRLSPNTVKSFVTPEYAYTVRTNSQGFRGREPAPRSPGEYRVLLLGDSMVWGVGCSTEQTLAGQLEALAAAASVPGTSGAGRDRGASQHAGEPGVADVAPEPANPEAPSVGPASIGPLRPARSLRVFDQSLPGYNTVQETLVAEASVPQLRPDHVLLGFFVGNDIVPNWIARIEVDEVEGAGHGEHGEGGEGRYAVSEPRVAALEAEIRSRFSFLWHSVAFRVLAASLWAPRLRYEIAGRSEVLGRSESLLRDLDRFCRERGIRFSVMLLYPGEGIAGGLVQSWTHSRSIGERLARFCQESGIEVVDMLRFMRGTRDRDRYYFRKDGHLNPAGHRETARVVYEQILRRRLETPSEDPGDDARSRTAIPPETSAGR